MTSYDVAIIDLIGQEWTQEDFIFDTTASASVGELNPQGLLWVTCEFDPHNFINSGPFEVAEKVATTTKWRLQNVIVRPDFTRTGHSFTFTDVCEFYLLFVNAPTHRFNKDLVREEHIWRHAEWGKREKNYFPLGKDPGNIWLPTMDDGQGTVIGHIPLGLEEAFARCILLGVPRQDEITLAQDSIVVNITTGRSVAINRIHDLLLQAMAAREKRFRQESEEVQRTEARNALVVALAEQVPLPFGQYAWEINHNDTSFSIIRARTNELIAEISLSPDLSELWGRAVTADIPVLWFSKAFKVEAAQRLIRKIRTSINGVWVPHEWDIRVTPL